MIGLGEKSFHKNYYGKLKRSAHYLELSGAVIEQTPNLILVINEKAVVINANRAACSFFDRDADELKDSSIYDLASIPYDNLKAGDEDTVILEGHDRESEVKKYLLSIKEIKVGSSKYSVLVGKDVTLLLRLQDEQRAYENQLLQFQKTDMVSFLAGSIAHDFNNILTGIIGCASMLRESRNITSDAPEQTLVQMILDASEKASDLVTQLMSVSRKGSMDKEPVSLAAVLEDTVGILGHTVDRSVCIEFHNDTDDACIAGNSSALHSAFLNLGINAGHAIRGEGRIEFRLSRLNIDSQYCGASSFALEPGEYLKLSVEDTGAGIPEEYLDRIFEALFTTREAGKGTGLGLSSVMKTVKDHSGEIRVASSVGKGTVFTLLFPASGSAGGVSVGEKKI